MTIINKETRFGDVDFPLFDKGDIVGGANNRDIKNTIFNGDVKNLHEFNILNFENCEFNSVLELTKHKYENSEGKLNIINSYVNNLKLSNDYIKNIDIKELINVDFNNMFYYGEKKIDIKFNIDFKANKGNKRNIIINGSKDLEYLRIYDLGNKIQFGNLSINYITGKNKNENSFYISTLKIKKLTISNCDFDDSLFLTDLDIGELIITDSNLGKTTFNGITIRKLTLKNATLNECIFNGVIFSSYILGKNIDKIKIPVEKLKDNYRQLKFIMDKNGNHTEANKFYGLEMEYYMNSLNLKNEGFLKMFNEGFFGENSRKIGEKFALYFSFITSEFSNNLSRILFAINLYIFLTYIIVFLSGMSQILFLKLWQEIFLLKGVNFNNIEVLNTIDKQADIFTFFLLFITLKYPNIDKLNNKKFDYLLNIIMLIIYLIIGFLSFGDFKGFNTLAFLINPLAGINYDIMSKMLWTEQIGLIIHKVIYGTLIYQLIITLKRTTKR